MKQGNRRAVEVLLHLFSDLDITERREEDGIVRIMTGGDSYALRPVWAGQGFPQDVEDALARDLGGGADPSAVVVARGMSESTRRMLRSRGLGWADESGNAEIKARPGLFISRGTAVRSVAVPQDWRWSPSAGAVAELLLTLGPAQDFQVPTVASVAGTLPISTAQVSKVLQRFDRQEWTRKVGHERGPGARRIVEKPSDLLSSWAAWQSRRHTPVVRAHATWRTASAFAAERLVPILGRRWCAGGWLAADQLAPFATEVPTITCYIDGEDFDARMPSILDEAGLRKVRTGGRVNFVRAEPHVLALASNEALPTASAPRVYADLLASGSRGEEAANHLREVLLDY